jgi:hypothetical protein
MRQFYKFLYAEGLRTDDPTGILDAPKKGRPLPKTMGVDEVGRLLEQAEAGSAGSRSRAIAAVAHAGAAGTALCHRHARQRAGLAAGPVLDQEGRFLMIRGKGNKERLVPLSQSAIAALKLYGGMMAAENAPPKIPPPNIPGKARGCFRRRRRKAICRGRFCPRSEKSCDPGGADPIYDLAARDAARICKPSSGQWRRPARRAGTLGSFGHFDHTNLHACPGRKAPATGPNASPPCQTGEKAGIGPATRVR